VKGIKKCKICNNDDTNSRFFSKDRLRHQAIQLVNLKIVDGAYTKEAATWFSE